MKGKHINLEQNCNCWSDVWVVVLEMDGRAVVMDCFLAYRDAREYAIDAAKRYRADGWMINQRVLHIRGVEDQEAE